jgi:hypothetical protein
MLVKLESNELYVTKLNVSIIMSSMIKIMIDFSKKLLCELNVECIVTFKLIDDFQ